MLLSAQPTRLAQTVSETRSVAGWMTAPILGLDAALLDPQADRLIRRRTMIRPRGTSQTVRLVSAMAIPRASLRQLPLAVIFCVAELVETTTPLELIANSVPKDILATQETVEAVHVRKRVLFGKVSF